MNRQKCERMKLLLQREDLDAVISLSPANAFYLTGFFVYDYWWCWTSNNEQTMIPVVPLEGDPFLVEYHWGWLPAQIPLLAEKLREAGLGHSRIGLDMEYAPVLFVDQLRQMLPEVKFVPADKVFWELRSSKTEKELGFMKKAIEACEDGIRNVLGNARKGIKINELRRLFNEGVTKHEGCKPMISGCPPGDYAEIYSADSDRAWVLKRQPSRYGNMEKNRLLHVDGCVINQGYWSDLMRPFGIGTIPATTFDLHRKSIELQEIVVNNVKVGRSVQEAYEKINLEAQKASIKVMRSHNWLVHGVGMGIHEEPSFGPPYHTPEMMKMKEFIIQPNTVITSEILGITMIEDMYLITKDEPKQLTTLSKEIFIK